MAQPPTPQTPPKPRLLALLLGVAIVLYPLLVYWGIQHFGPRILAGVLLVLALGKLLLARLTQQPQGNMGWLLLAASIATAITLATGSVIGLKFYPVLVNMVMLGVFGFSLWRPPSMIERFARLQHANLPNHAIAYTRKVTVVWCVFFVVNGCIAFATVFASHQAWALYNGLIAYGLMGALLGGEYLVRLRVQRQYSTRLPQ